ncbi:uncharacterized protein CDV56_102729 [Aspergillus thermomutatus]|uniref:Uncharacterized protein n=1 Tax=Aspergillus thermomutatus TaxID=41047 RepID=A0A397GIE4_ASPTH|nr:uncharacterized protein CDV56_102729 [Aspergillus thermomutatus]RHZ50732.1 hypothetical protein CDV56_102729 [Aspergillus thermomutatus]
MKFTGIIASLAVASSASALVIPQAPVDATLNKLNSALDNVEGLVGGLLNGVCQEVDLTQVQTELTDIKGQLTKLVPVSVATKRDIMGTVNGVATPATNVAGSAVGTVEGVAKPVTNVADSAVGTVENTAGAAVGTVKNTASGAVDTVTGTVGVKRQEVGQLTTLAQNLVSKIQSGALDAAGLENVLNILGQTGGLSAVTTILNLIQ